MCKKWKAFQETLGDVIIMSKKEYLLIVTVGVLGGLVTGLLFSPRKHTMIGSLNGIGNCDSPIKGAEYKGDEENKKGER